jgi:hypothetical protein
LWYSNCSFSIWWLCKHHYTATEEYDGSTWTTSPGSINTARYLAGAGTQTSALAFGGNIHLQEQQNYMMVLLGHQIQQV